MAVVSVFVGARRDARQDAQLSGLVATVSREREQLRRRATDEILSALLRPGTKEIPLSYRFTVYLFEPRTNRLQAAFPRPGAGEQELHAFRSGAGATGFAFQRKELILVTGDAVSIVAFGEMPEERAERLERAAEESDRRFALSETQRHALANGGL